jgi:hypothetical protein
VRAADAIVEELRAEWQRAQERVEALDARAATWRRRIDALGWRASTPEWESRYAAVRARAESARAARGSLERVLVAAVRLHRPCAWCLPRRRWPLGAPVSHGMCSRHEAQLSREVARG